MNNIHRKITAINHLHALEICPPARPFDNSTAVRYHCEVPPQEGVALDEMQDL